MSDFEYPIINGVPFPARVFDLESLKTWIKSIDRPLQTSTKATAGVDIFGHHVTHQERYYFAPFFEGDGKGRSQALALCCHNIATQMYWDIVRVPHGTVFIRTEPETDESGAQPLPADLKDVKARKDLAGNPLIPLNLEHYLPNEGWSVNHMTDTIFRRAPHSEKLRLMKSYVRYACAVMPKEG